MTVLNPVLPLITPNKTCMTRTDYYLLKCLFFSWPHQEIGAIHSNKFIVSFFCQTSVGAHMITGIWKSCSIYEEWQRGSLLWPRTVVAYLSKSPGGHHALCIWFHVYSTSLFTCFLLLLAPCVSFLLIIFSIVLMVDVFLLIFFPVFSQLNFT